MKKQDEGKGEAVAAVPAVGTTPITGQDPADTPYMPVDSECKHVAPVAADGTTSGGIPDAQGVNVPVLAAAYAQQPAGGVADALDGCLSQVGCRWHD